MTLTIGEVLREAKQELNLSQTPQLDAELLLSKVIAKPRSFIMAYREQLLTGEQLTAFNTLINQRAQQIPIAYLLGQKSFWTFELQITKDVLIPRPETELLVETILDDHTGIKNLRVLELGTGTGAIAIALAQEKPDWQITAIDISQAALNIAQMNAKNILSHSTIHFAHSDWMENLRDDYRCDIIVSNPPYLAHDDPHLIASEISHEPQLALIAENKGLAAYQTIAKQAKKHLHPNGRIYLEHGNTQAQSISEIFEAQNYARIKCLQDLASQDRISVFTI